jgi:ABC-type dipeptide/oligopeptide/nickel transport system permease component
LLTVAVPVFGAAAVFSLSWQDAITETMATAAAKLPNFVVVFIVY